MYSLHCPKLILYWSLKNSPHDEIVSPGPKLRFFVTHSGSFLADTDAVFVATGVVGDGGVDVGDGDVVGEHDSMGIDTDNGVVVVVVDVGVSEGAGVDDGEDGVDTFFEIFCFGSH